MRPDAIDWLRSQHSKPALRQGYAFHEASHVIVAACEHVRVTEASIEWKFGGFEPDAIDSCGRTSFDETSCDHFDYLERILKSARIALAGRIGEQIARGRNPVLAILRYVGSDLASIKNAEILTISYSEEARVAWLRLQWLIVRDTLRKHWDSVKAVADSLSEREVLSGAEVHEILTRSGFYGTATD